MHVLHSSLLISDKLSTRLDNEVDLNLKLSITFSLYVSLLPCSFLIGTEKVIYFSSFSPIKSNRPLILYANCLIIK